jgi:hypothetical protein
MKSTSRYILLVLITALFSLTGHAQSADKWFAAWAGSIQGPYPVGNPSAQPDMHFAFPSAETGARDQTFRMIVRPDIWGPQTRLHLSNVLGTRPVTFDGVFVGLQRGSSAVVAGTNQAVSFAGKKSVTVDAGNSVWSDPVALPFAEKLDAIALTGRKLAVSFHVAGESGPMTWHAKALNTSYVSQSGAGSLGQSEDEFAFPFSTASWYFLDTVDMMASSDTQVVVALGDSITDGTATSMNGDDRWADVLARRLHAVYGNRISVVNAGIAAIKWWDHPRTPRRNRFRAGLLRRRAWSGTSLAFPASRRSSGSKASTISARTAMHPSRPSSRV